MSAAARYLLSLGARVAPEVLAHADAAVVRETLTQVAGLEPDPAFRHLDPGLRPATWLATQRALSRCGPAEAREVAAGLVGPEGAGGVLGEIEELWEEPARRGEPAEPFEARESEELAGCLVEHSPEGVALALALAPRALGRRTLVDLLEEGREDVLGWFGCLHEVYPGVMELEETGEDILGDLLDGLRDEVRDRVLGCVERVHPALHRSLQSRRFSIRELECLEDPALEDLVGRVSVEDLALALREAPESLRRRCLRALPRARRTQVGEELASSQPVRLRDVQRARERLGAALRREVEGGDLAEAL